MAAAEQRYRVTERLEAGGMAEVFRGEAVSIQGFKRQVAIKRVLPHLAQNKGFISMFLDEARLGSRLTHANVVSVLDIGAADNTYFIVMEFIDGCNLKTIIEEYRQSGRRIEVKDAVYMIVEAAKGLSFAHELVDDDGRPLNIVHRDISPPNILLSKRGEVKVTDFGLAKATTQLEKTDPGVVKGKFSYLSPEAAMGQTVDARTDIFALGIVLWEMLAGRRLFLGETDYQTVKMVQQAQIPSLSRMNPEVDTELEAIIMKAMAKDPAERFGSARDLGDSLTHYLFAKQLKVSSYDLANVVTRVVEAKAAAKAGQQREQSIIDRLIQEELIRFTSIGDLAEPLVPVEMAPRDFGGPAGASLENPADWFKEDDDVLAGIGGEQGKAKDEKGWRESGVEVGADSIADLLDESVAEIEAETSPKRPSLAPEVGKRSVPSDVPTRPSGEIGIAKPAESRAPSARPLAQPSAPPAPPKSSGSAGMMVAVVVVVAIGAAAAAYFGGFLG